MLQTQPLHSFKPVCSLTSSEPRAWPHTSKPQRQVSLPSSWNRRGWCPGLAWVLLLGCSRPHLHWGKGEGASTFTWGPDWGLVGIIQLWRLEEEAVQHALLGHSDNVGQPPCPTEWLERVLASQFYFCRSRSLFPDRGPRKAKQLVIVPLRPFRLSYILEWLFTGFVSIWPTLTISKNVCIFKKYGVSRLAFQDNYFEWANSHLCVWILECSLRKPHSLLYSLYLQVHRPYIFSQESMVGWVY